MSPRLRRKRIWTVADFAEHAGVPHWTAKRMLQALDRELGGMLLRRGEGKRGKLMFFRDSLFRHAPDLARDLQELEARVDALEEAIDAATLAQRVVAQQTGANTREIQRLKSRPRAA